MRSSTRRFTPAWLALAAVFALAAAEVATAVQSSSAEAAASESESTVHVEFLEIVTADVETTCATLSALRGVTFSDPVPVFGNARTAPLVGGGMLSVRAPMREDEAPVVRPYVLVDDIEAAVAAVEKAGGQIAVPPMDVPQGGRYAVYLLGGNQHGLWQR